MLKRFEPRRFDDPPTENWETRDIALWAARNHMTHEEICSQRWGVLIKLMWSALAGIGSLIILVAGTCISNLLTLPRVH